MASSPGREGMERGLKVVFMECFEKPLTPSPWGSPRKLLENDGKTPQNRAFPSCGVNG